MAAIASVPTGAARPWYVLSPQARSRIAKLGLHMAVTSDFGRPYRCGQPWRVTLQQLGR